MRVVKNGTNASKHHFYMGKRADNRHCACTWRHVPTGKPVSDESLYVAGNSSK